MVIVRTISGELFTAPASPCSRRVSRTAPTAASGTGFRARRLSCRPTAPGRPLLRLIGVVRPRCLDPGEVPGAVRLTLDPARLLGPAHRRLAHPELAGELAITGHAHPYKCPEVKS